MMSLKEFYETDFRLRDKDYIWMKQYVWNGVKFDLKLEIIMKRVGEKKWRITEKPEGGKMETKISPEYEVSAYLNWANRMNKIFQTGDMPFEKFDTYVDVVVEKKNIY